MYIYATSVAIHQLPRVLASCDTWAADRIPFDLSGVDVYSRASTALGVGDCLRRRVGCRPVGRVERALLLVVFSILASCSDRTCTLADCTSVISFTVLGAVNASLGTLEVCVDEDCTDYPGSVVFGSGSPESGDGQLSLAGLDETDEHVVVAELTLDDGREFRSPGEVMHEVAPNGRECGPVCFRASLELRE